MIRYNESPFLLGLLFTFQIHIMPVSKLAEGEDKLNILLNLITLMSRKLMIMAKILYAKRHLT